MKKLRLLTGLVLLPSPALAQLAIIAGPNGSEVQIGSMQWGVESPNKSWSVFNVNPTTLHFELRAGDHWPQDYSTSVQRVEIDQGQRNLFGPGTYYTTQFDYTVLPGGPNTSRWVVLYQLAYPFKGICVWNASPVVAFELKGEHLALTATKAGHGQCTPGATRGTQVQWTLWRDPLPVARGTTHNFKITMLFDANDPNGSVQAWRDGLQI